MIAPLTGTFSTRSLMCRQRFRNGRRRTCSLYPPRQLPQLSRTSGTLLLLGFRRPRTVVVTSWPGYDHDINHGFRESGVHMGTLPLSSYLHSIFVSVWVIPWQRSFMQRIVGCSYWSPIRQFASLPLVTLVVLYTFVTLFARPFLPPPDPGLA